MEGIIVLLVLIEVKRVLSNRSVIPPVQGMTFLEIASCSFSSRTILESRDFTTLLI